MRAALLALAALLLCAEARAQQPDLAAGITDDAVSVASDYRGARLTVFGVHWRRGRAPSDVVIVLRGPGEGEIVRRKRRIAGIWINTDPVQFRGAPTFFALASTRPVQSFLTPAAIANYGLDPGALARLSSRTPADTDSATYRRALVRLKQSEGLYRVIPRGIVVQEDGAFKMPFVIPPNAPVGTYSVEVYLFRGGKLVQRKPGTVTISRIGIEKTIYSAAHERPLLYGFAAVLLALAAGYAAAFVFRRN